MRQRTCWKCGQPFVEAGDPSRCPFCAAPVRRGAFGGRHDASVGRFPPGFRGYKVEDVDALFARIDAKLATAEEIDEATFRGALRGYDMDSVDEALERAAEEARRREAAGSMG